MPCEVIGSKLYQLEQNVVKTCNIAVGETVDIPFNFEGLTVNSTYTILVCIPDGDEVEYLNWNNGSIKYIYIFTMLEDTAIQDIKLDAPDADVYDMHGVRLGKAADLKTLPKGIYIINKKKVVNK